MNKPTKLDPAGIGIVVSVLSFAMGFCGDQICFIVMHPALVLYRSIERMTTEHISRNTLAALTETQSIAKGNIERIIVYKLPAPHLLIELKNHKKVVAEVPQQDRIIRLGNFGTPVWQCDCTDSLY